MKKNKLISLAFILILMAGLFVACSQPEEELSSLEKIKENDVIRIGVFGDKPPFGYIDENGENQGYDIYLAKRITKDLLGDESKVEFVVTEAANRVEYLQSGKVDLILANFTVTPERKEAVDFANPYMNYRCRAIRR